MSKRERAKAVCDNPLLEDGCDGVAILIEERESDERRRSVLVC